LALQAEKVRFLEREKKGLTLRNFGCGLEGFHKVDISELFALLNVSQGDLGN
jgi:hypothetical protein